MEKNSSPPLLTEIRINGTVTTFSGELGIDRVIAQIEMLYPLNNSPEENQL